MQIAMVQDKILPLGEVDSVYFDRGMFFGDGVYEVLRSYNGKIFALDDHLQRFANSLAAIDIRGIDMALLRKRILTAFQQSEIVDAKIYFHITRGTAPRDLLDRPDLTPNFFMTVTELENITTEKQKGIAVSTHPDWRWQRCAIKSLNLLGNVLARRDAAKKGCQEAILVDDSGLITEGASSSFFAVFDLPAERSGHGARLHTSSTDENILPSITRDYILCAARELGMEVVEESLTGEQATMAQELFVASTTRDIVPVVSFDGHAIGDGRPGKWTKRLIEAFQVFL